MTLLRELLASFEALWPASGAEAWDAPGLIVGNGAAEITRVLLTIDVTAEVIEEAAGKYDLVLAHHPFLLRGITQASEGSAKGFVLAKAIRNNLAIFAAHTNADIVSAGVSETLAGALGIKDLSPLVSTSNPVVGHGRIGTLSEPLLLGDFARTVARILPPTATGVRVAGAYTQTVQKIAVCGGAGDSFITAAFDAGADVYLTADLRHHVVQDARESALLTDSPLAIIDVSHWASEWLWLDVAASQLRQLHTDVTFDVCELRTDPFDFVITQ